MVFAANRAAGPKCTWARIRSWRLYEGLNAFGAFSFFVYTGLNVFRKSHQSPTETKFSAALFRLVLEICTFVYFDCQSMRQAMTVRSAPRLVRFASHSDLRDIMI